jgi:hypothetical protein
MSRPVAYILGAFALLIAGWLGYAALNAWWLTPRATLIDVIQKGEAGVANRENTLARRPALDRALDDFAQRTLGSNLEAVDARLRSRLNRIAEEVGLNGASVGTGARSRKQSPMRQAFERRGAWRELRDTNDFEELEGWVGGEGTIEQAVLLVDRIIAEPWMKRVDNVKLDAKDNGARIAVTVRLTTLYMTDLGHDDAPTAPPYDPARLDAFASLSGSNPFHVPDPEPEPAPEVVAVEQTPPPQPAAPPFPWEHWVLTGVGEGPHGPEAWLRNTSSGKRRVMSVGDRLGPARIVEIGVDWIAFSIDEDQFRVRTGGILSDRRPLVR